MARLPTLAGGGQWRPYSHRTNSHEHPNSMPAYRPHTAKVTDKLRSGSNVPYSIFFRPPKVSTCVSLWTLTVGWSQGDQTLVGRAMIIKTTTSLYHTHSRVSEFLRNATVNSYRGASSANRTALNPRRPILLETEVASPNLI